MLNASLNSTQATQAQGRVSNGEKNVFAALGEQISQDPEIAKLLLEQGELPENFQDALKNMSFEDAQSLVDNVNKQVDAAQLAQQGLNAKMNALLPGNVERGEFVKEAIPGDVNVTAEQTKTSETAKSELQQFLTKNPKLKEQAAQKLAQTNVNIAKTEAGVKPDAKLLQNNQGLVDLNHFMSKQSNSGKTRAVNSQYKNEQQSLITNKVFEQKNPDMGQSFSDSEGSSLGDMGQGPEQLLNLKAQNNSLQSVQNSAKVFDLNALTKTGDVDVVINQIQDYIVQARAAKEPTAQMSFNHPELGDIDVLVQKVAGDKINVVIGHQGAEAGKFFQKHQGELVQTLQQSGIQVSEFKLESSSTNNNGNNQNNTDSNSKQFANQQQKTGDQQKREEDSHRREELWNLLNKERKSA